MIWIARNQNKIGLLENTYEFPFFCFHVVPLTRINFIDNVLDD